VTFIRNYPLSSQLFNFFVMNAGVSQSSHELSGARNALFVVGKSGALSTFVDENPQV
jgi:hypothetical protein